MKAQNMGPVAKPKPVRRASARLTRRTTASEDDAEQALREIVATIGKADQATGRQRKKFARKTSEKSSIENERASDQKHD
jgi:hypothetical protein